MSLRMSVRMTIAALALAPFLLGGGSHVSASGSPMVATLAGGGAGDAGTATAAEVDVPAATAVDASGNMYVVNSGDCRVRKVTAGTMTTVAGTGACGYGGDGGPATAAALKAPQGIAFDTSGNLYIADTGNCRVRKVSGTTITTVAGNGICGFSGDGAAATGAMLSFPWGVTLDSSNNIYIADAANCRIRKVTAGTISTVAGTTPCGYGGDGGPATSANLSLPQSVAVDSSGTLYIADTNNCLVRKVTAGVISIAAGHTVIDPFSHLLTGKCAFEGDGGPATSASVFSPGGVAVTGATLLIADTNNCVVRAVTAGTINTIAGSGGCGFGGDGGPAASAQLALPSGLATDASGVIYIADTGNCRVRQINGTTMNTVAGNGACGYGGDGAKATAAALHGPTSVAAAPNGNVYITDTGNCRVRMVSNRIITTIAGTGVCGYSGDGGPATSAMLDAPQGIAVDGSGNVYIADTTNCRVRKVVGTTINTIAGTGACSFSGDGGAATAAAISPITSLAFDTSGNLYIGDTGNCRVRKITGTTISTVAGNGSCQYAGDGGSATAASLFYPHGIALDASGNLYIADTQNCRIRKVSAGTITTIAGSGLCSFAGDGGLATAAQMNAPQGVALDASGNLYIADTGNCRVRKLTGTTITTAAGTGVCWFAGDFGAPAAASVNSPWNLTVDAAGDVLIADTEDNRIRGLFLTDTDGDTLGDGAETLIFGTDPLKADTDGDGCGDGPEVKLWSGRLDPINPWDFYSVPVPALFAAPNPLTDFKDSIISASDGQAVFAYFRRGAVAGQADYEADRNGNGIKDGIEYDRTILGAGKTGPPDGVISASEAQADFAQFKQGLGC